MGGAGEELNHSEGTWGDSLSTSPQALNSVWMGTVFFINPLTFLLAPECDARLQYQVSKYPLNK